MNLLLYPAFLVDVKPNSVGTSILYALKRCIAIFLRIPGPKQIELMHHSKPYCFNHDLFNVSLLIMFINYTKSQNTIYKFQRQNSQDRLNQIKETTMSRACHYGPMYPKIHPTEVDTPLIVKNMGRLNKIMYRSIFMLFIKLKL